MDELALVLYPLSPAVTLTHSEYTWHFLFYVLYIYISLEIGFLVPVD